MRHLTSGVVQIRSTTVLTTLPLPTEQEELDRLTNTVDYTVAGNGFFIKGGRIVCPAHLVIIPPQYLSAYNRFPRISETQPAPTGTMPNQISQVSRIEATITPFELDGKKCERSFSYQLRLVSTDPIQGLAELEVDNNCLYNGTAENGNPTLFGQDCDCSCWNKGSYARVHHFEWAKQPNDGEEITVVSSTVNRNFAASATDKVVQVKGTLASSNYMDGAGHILPQLSMLNIPGAFFPNSGGAVVDKCGHIVGMLYTTPCGSSFSPITLTPVSTDPGAIGQKAFPQGNLPHGTLSIGEGVISAINVSELKRFINNKYCCNGQLVTLDNNSYEEQDFSKGPFRVTYHAYAGIAYRKFQGTDYTVAVDYDGSVTGNPGFEYSLFDADGLITGIPYKEVSGILVSALAGNSGPAFLVPGSPQQGVDSFPAAIADSPFLTDLDPGDKILAVDIADCEGNCCTFPVHQAPDYYTPSQILAFVPVGGSVRFKYSPGDNPVDRFCDIECTEYRILNPVPAFMNYPYSKGISLPVINTPVQVGPIPSLATFPNFKAAF